MVTSQLRGRSQRDQRRRNGQARILHAYVKDRLTGSAAGAGERREEREEEEEDKLAITEMIESQKIFERLGGDRAATGPSSTPACDGPVSLRDRGRGAHRHRANLKEAVGYAKTTDVFMTAASPGVIAAFSWPTPITPASGGVLRAGWTSRSRPPSTTPSRRQHRPADRLPDLAMTRAMLGNDPLHRRAVPSTRSGCTSRALDDAVRDVPPEQMRLRLCWGNGEWPHMTDIPLAWIIDVVLEARPTGLVFEAANPRHEHEWTIWKDVGCPTARC